VVENNDRPSFGGNVFDADEFWSVDDSEQCAKYENLAFTGMKINERHTNGKREESDGNPEQGVGNKRHISKQVQIIVVV